MDSCRAVEQDEFCLVEPLALPPASINNTGSSSGIARDDVVVKSMRHLALGERLWLLSINQTVGSSVLLYRTTLCRAIVSYTLT